ncbi:MAG: ArsR/SmtB family transcription factor [Spirochaetota bacterium]
MESTSRSPGPAIGWDHGTAYDLFSSLYGIHNPERFGIRRSWAAGVRNRLSPERRDLLGQFVERVTVPLCWLRSLGPGVAADAALASLASLEPARVMPTLCPPSSGCSERSPADDERIGAELYPALSEYVERFFVEEVPRVEPVVSEGLARARTLAANLDPVQLVEELSGGLALEDVGRAPSLTLIPVFWMGPLVLFDTQDDGSIVMLFSARPRTVSLVPGDQVPESLMLGLQAIADPTRLRVMRLLAETSMTQAELARALRLRPSTMTHHLRTLRMANVIRLRENAEGEKRYEVRSRRLQELYGDLEGFTGIAARP